MYDIYSCTVYLLCIHDNNGILGLRSAAMNGDVMEVYFFFRGHVSS